MMIHVPCKLLSLDAMNITVIILLSHYSWLATHCSNYVYVSLFGFVFYSPSNVWCYNQLFSSCSFFTFSTTNTVQWKKINLITKWQTFILLYSCFLLFFCLFIYFVDFCLKIWKMPTFGSTNSRWYLVCKITWKPHLVDVGKWILLFTTYLHIKSFKICKVQTPLGWFGISNWSKMIQWIFKKFNILYIVAFLTKVHISFCTMYSGVSYICNFYTEKM